jgi:HEAT repeat protein
VISPCARPENGVTDRRCRWHDPGVDIDLAALFDHAVAVSRAVTQPDDSALVLDAAARAAEVDPDTVTFALARIGDDDPVIRATACDFIAAAAQIEESVRGDAATALIALAEHEPDTDVLWSIARALGDTTDGRAAMTLVRLAGHEDSDVRFQVASALPFVFEEADAEAEDAVVAALIALSADVNDEVRNWATFGLGWSIEADGDDIRAALWQRCSDPYADAREEGIRGLARRRDRRALPLVARLLSTGDPLLLTFEAAGFLADPSLLPLLANYDSDDSFVPEALAACDPIRRAAVDAAAWTVFEQASLALPGRAVAIGCNRYEIGEFLTVDDVGWSVSHLLARVGGDPGAAADLVVASANGLFLED